MKGSLLRKSMYLFCAMAGMLAGYGIVTFHTAKENIDNTKDNTLIRENGDSVFFAEENVETKQLEILIMPTQNSTEQIGKFSKSFSTEQISVTSELPSMLQPQILSETISSSSQNIPEPTLTLSIQMQDLPEDTVTQTLAPIEVSTATDKLVSISNSISSAPEMTQSSETSINLTPPVTPPVTPEPSVLPIMPIPSMPEKNTDSSEDNLPSLGVQWISGRQNIPQVTLSSITPKQETPAEEVITYPVQIFGQVPVINRSDAYVSYFEFSYDLITMLEPIVEARGQNMNSLLTKFVIKALLCGVDIEKLDINAPIPRRLAALCLWLTAQMLNESGCDISAQSAEGYVADITGCSASEKKAVAYLYESGILNDTQISGGHFYPTEGLKTEDGKAWLSAVKQYWN